MKKVKSKQLKTPSPKETWLHWLSKLLAPLIGGGLLFMWGYDRFTKHEKVLLSLNQTVIALSLADDVALEHELNSGFLINKIKNHLNFIRKVQSAKHAAEFNRAGRRFDEVSGWNFLSEIAAASDTFNKIEEKVHPNFAENLRQAKWIIALREKAHESSDAYAINELSKLPLVVLMASDWVEKGQAFQELSKGKEIPGVIFRKLPEILNHGDYPVVDLNNSKLKGTVKEFGDITKKGRFFVPSLPAIRSLEVEHGMRIYRPKEGWELQRQGD